MDLHLSAIHGVRFEPAAALAARERIVDASTRLGLDRQAGFGWVCFAQAHAVAGRRCETESAAARARELAPEPRPICGGSAWRCSPWSRRTGTARWPSWPPRWSTCVAVKAGVRGAVSRDVAAGGRARCRRCRRGRGRDRRRADPYGVHEIIDGAIVRAYHRPDQYAIDAFFG